MQCTVPLTLMQPTHCSGLMLAAVITMINVFILSHLLSLTECTDSCLLLILPSSKCLDVQSKTTKSFCVRERGFKIYFTPRALSSYLSLPLSSVPGAEIMQFKHGTQEKHISICEWHSNVNTSGRTFTWLNARIRISSVQPVFYLWLNPCCCSHTGQKQ